jgi:hypothetical protein
VEVLLVVLMCCKLNILEDNISFYLLEENFGENIKERYVKGKGDKTKVKAK